MAGKVLKTSLLRMEMVGMKIDGGRNSKVFPRGSKTNLRLLL
jgi:hypothetical protein